MEFILKVQSGDIPRNLAILSMPTLQGVLHLYLIGGGVTTPDKSTYLNAFAAVKSAAETCGVCSIKIGMVAKNQCPCLL